MIYIPIIKSVIGIRTCVSLPISWNLRTVLKITNLALVTIESISECFISRNVSMAEKKIILECSLITSIHLEDSNVLVLYFVALQLTRYLED